MSKTSDRIERITQDALERLGVQVETIDPLLQQVNVYFATRPKWPEL